MRYKFIGRTSDGKQYIWESINTISPRESRHERIICSVAWFWSER